MTWRCAYCAEEDGVDAVCHHCGTLLCREHRTEIAERWLTASSRFEHLDGRTRRRRPAVHCRDCVDDHSFLARWTGRMVR